MWIDGISEDVLEIGISTDGAHPDKYTYYFNKETAQISDSFLNPIVFGDKYIAYMEDDDLGAGESTLILLDIFKEGIVHQEITRDFSKTEKPMSAIISIEMVDSENIRLEYYKGETYTIESEIVGVVYNGTEENVTEKELENVSVEKAFIDYDYIEKYHEILIHNIGTSPKDDYDDTILVEYLKADIEKDKELMESGSGEGYPLTIDYNLFDFNDDGLLKEVFSITMRLHEYAWLNEHSPIAILDEKDDGYYAFVAVGTNRIHRYDKEKGRYLFADE